MRIGAQRGSGDAVRVTARPGEDVVVLTIANGPTLVLHPEDARDLLRAQAAGATRSAAKGEAGEVTVSAQLGWPKTRRSTSSPRWQRASSTARSTRASTS